MMKEGPDLLPLHYLTRIPTLSAFSERITSPYSKVRTDGNTGVSHKSSSDLAMAANEITLFSFSS